VGTQSEMARVGRRKMVRRERRGGIWGRNIIYILGIEEILQHEQKSFFLKRDRMNHML
jgi:hypothetical protein